RLDLSAWTVSRAINGHAEVNPKTRERIRLAMEELGFRPNPLARGLRGSGTNLIGVSFIGMRSPIMTTKLFHLQERLREHKFRCVLEVMRDQATELRVLDDLLQMHVDGVVLCYSTLPSGEGPHVRAKVPHVHVDPMYPQPGPTVALDRRRAMEMLMKHLLDLGHRRFGLLGIGRDDAWRWPALLDIARANGLDAEKAYVHCGPKTAPDKSLASGSEMAALALRHPQRPTALVCVNDIVAIGAIHGVKTAGLSVPGDISVTGFDNIEVGHYLQPTLTTIEQNSPLLMQTAVDLLLGQIRRKTRTPKATPTVSVEPLLVVGESTGPAKG
ncbi:MAG: LacI family DNA-binding transcriptional regulator, partial [Verrucomicrobiota bacterium]